MDELDYLKNQYEHGEISRRQFVKNAVALGMSTAVAVAFLRTAVASTHTPEDNWEVGIKVFPIAAKDSTAVSLPSNKKWDGVKWNPKEPSNMLNYAARRFRKAQGLDPNFGRAYGGLAYTCLIAHAEGWEFEKDLNPGLYHAQQATKLLEQAKTFADVALSKGPHYYDNHWSKAIAHMYSQEWQQALNHYQHAEALIAAQNPNGLSDFRFEMADFWTHYGDHAKAAQYCSNANATKEWHHHQIAFCEFAGARTDNDPKARYENAMNELELVASSEWDVDAPTPTPNKKRLTVADILWATCDHYLGTGDITKSEKRRKGKKRFKQHPHFATWKSNKKSAEKYGPFRIALDATHWTNAANPFLDST